MPHPFESLVNNVANEKKRASWWADLDDLRQEGHVAVLRAQSTFDPAVGVPADAYFRRAIELAMARLLWKDSAPVSGGMHRPRESLKGLYRASLTLPDGEPRILIADVRPADVALDNAVFRTRVRASLVELAGGNERLVAGLLEEVSIEDLAAERPARSIFVHRHCVVVREHDRIREVRKELAQLRARASADEPLYKLARAR